MHGAGGMPLRLSDREILLITTAVRINVEPFAMPTLADRCIDFGGRHADRQTLAAAAVIAGQAIRSPRQEDRDAGYALLHVIGEAQQVDRFYNPEHAQRYWRHNGRLF